MKDLLYIDTHAHLNLPQFAEDGELVLDKMRQLSVGAINVGTCKESSLLAVQLANENPDCLRAIVGLHPLNIFNEEGSHYAAEPVFDYDWYRNLAEQNFVVGIGECGFDYFHHSDSTYEVQKAAFLAQVQLANELKKPLMLHLRNSKDGLGRNAYDDALEILKSEAKVKGNAHFFAGTLEQAEAFIALGFTVSFTGVVTFAKDYEELVATLPLAEIHAETDCPYVAPKPYRGQRCEPWMVIEVYKKIAALKGLADTEVQEQLLQNAANLYRW